jgi:hypothetical protein
VNDSMVGQTAEDAAKRVNAARRFMEESEAHVRRCRAAMQGIQQTFTRPARLYDEEREEAAPMHFQEETEAVEQAAEKAVAASVAATGDASLNERMGHPAPVIGWASPTDLERLADRHRAELEAATVPDVAVATVGELIDRLGIVNVKIYHLEDVVRESEDTQAVCDAARKTRELNRERSALKNAITRMTQGDGARVDVKIGK